jgi:peptidoglycan/xylan/chitin deacetylase (PgdA/CDA1 family)
MVRNIHRKRIICVPRRALLFILLVLCAPSLRAREIALTFDDCPRKVSRLMNGMERAKKLTRELEKANVRQAAFFCNSPSRSEDGLKRIGFFANAGHLIANHSAEHPDLYTTPVEEFTRSIDLADKELRGFPNFRRWFRFPFLHEGKTSADVEAVRAHLTKVGYMNGYVTVDTQDWYMNELLVQGVDAGKKFNLNRLCETYKSMLVDEAEFFDNMSVKALGRSVKHIILLHETDLNALCIGEVVRGLHKKEWIIVSPDIAYTDPISQTEPSSATKLNQGRVSALARDAGYKGPYFSKWNEEEDIAKEFARRKVWK